MAQRATKHGIMVKIAIVRETYVWMCPLRRFRCHPCATSGTTSALPCKPSQTSDDPESDGGESRLGAACALRERGHDRGLPKPLLISTHRSTRFNRHLTRRFAKCTAAATAEHFEFVSLCSFSDVVSDSDPFGLAGLSLLVVWPPPSFRRFLLGLAGALCLEPARRDSHEFGRRLRNSCREDLCLCVCVLLSHCVSRPAPIGHVPRQRSSDSDGSAGVLVCCSHPCPSHIVCVCVCVSSRS